MVELFWKIINFKIPEWFIAGSVFYCLLAATVLAAILVVTLKNVFHSAMALAVTLIGIAAVYLYLSSEFLAIMQILLYVGAILTLIIFAVMLTTRLNDRNVRQSNEQKLISFLLAISLFTALVIAIAKMSAAMGPVSDKVVTFKDIGNAVLSEYALPFEFISVVLLASLIGAIALAFRKKGEE